MSESEDETRGEISELKLEPVPGDEWFEFLFKCETRDFAIVKKALGAMEGRVIVMSYPQLAPSEDSRRQLLSVLQRECLKVFKVSSIEQLPESVREHVLSKSKLNAINHEFQHLEGIPNPSVRSDSLMVLAIVDLWGKKELAGIALCDNKKLSWYERCLSLLAPEWLSVGDQASFMNMIIKLEEKGRTKEIRTLQQTYSQKEKQPEDLVK